MSRLVIAALLGAGLLPQDPLAPETLLRLKAATVLVQATGKGGARIGTAAYVAGPAGPVLLTSLALVRDADEFVAVYLPNTPREKRVPAKVLAEDPDRELAVLRPEGPELPKPLDLAEDAAPKETQPLYLLGYPPGGGGLPFVSVQRGSVSSLRHGTDGLLEWIQIEGRLAPGMGGGPVVDTSGRLLGTAVATLKGTQISFAAPVAAIRDLLRGRTGSPVIEETVNAGGLLRWRVALPVTDPHSLLRDVEVRWTPKARVLEPKPGPGGWTELVPGMAVAKATVKGFRADAVASIEGTVGESHPQWFQVRATRLDGSEHWSAPVEKAATFLAGAPGAAGRKEKEDWIGSEEQAARAKAIASGLPYATGVPLSTPPFDEGPFRRVRLKLGKVRLSGAAWSTDGRRFFVLEHETWILREISYPDLVETRQLVLKGVGGTLVRTKLGPAIVGTRHAALLDEDKLVLKKIQALGPDEFLNQVVSSPGSSTIFVHNGGAVMAGLDLGTGARARHLCTTYQAATGIRGHSTSERFQFWGRARLSPDGRNLLVQSRSTMHRFEVSGAGLSYQEASPLGEIFSPGFSGDSRMVVSISPGPPPKDPKEASPLRIRWHRVDNLQKAVKEAAFPAAAWAPAWDPLEKCWWVLGVDGRRILMVDEEGVIRKDRGLAAIPGWSGEPQLEVRPGGGGLLVSSLEAVDWIEELR